MNQSEVELLRQGAYAPGRTTARRQGLLRGRHRRYPQRAQPRAQDRGRPHAELANKDGKDKAKNASIKVKATLRLRPRRQRRRCGGRPELLGQGRADMKDAATLGS